MEKADRLAMEQMAQEIEILKRQVKTLEEEAKIASAALWWAMSDRSRQIEDLGRLFLDLRERQDQLNYRIVLWSREVEKHQQALRAQAEAQDLLGAEALKQARLMERVLGLIEEYRQVQDNLLTAIRLLRELHRAHVLARHSEEPSLEETRAWTTDHRSPTWLRLFTKK